MARIYKLFRALIMTLVTVAVLVPAALYVVLSTDWAQEKIRNIAEDELTKVLGTMVEIGHVRISPFSRLELNRVKVADDYGKTALSVKSVDTRFEFWHFLTKFELSFDYAELYGAEIALYKQTPDSPLNISEILERLKPKKASDEPTKFDLSVFTVRVNDASFKFDILNQPQKETGFDKNHISLKNVDLIATAPEISNERIDITLRRLSFTESHGFELTDLSAGILFTPSSLSLKDLLLQFPSTRLELGSYEFDYDSPDGLSNVFKTIPIHLTVNDGSFITLHDLRYLVPKLSGLNERFDIAFDGELSQSNIRVLNFDIRQSVENSLALNLKGEALNYNIKDSLCLNNIELETSVNTSNKEFTTLLSSFVKKPILDKVSMLGEMTLALKGNATSNSGKLDAIATTGIGKIGINTEVRAEHDYRVIKTKTDLNILGLDLGKLLNRTDIDVFSSVLHGDIVYEKGRLPYGELYLEEGSAIYRGDLFDGISLNAEMKRDGAFDASFDFVSENGDFEIDLYGTIDKNSPLIGGSFSFDKINLFELGLINKYPGYCLDAQADFNLSGKVGEWIDGFASMTKVRFMDQTGEGITIDHLSVIADNSKSPNEITIESDFLNGTVQGKISPWTIASEGREILAKIMPSILGTPLKESDDSVHSKRPENNFVFNLQIENAEKLLDFFKIPLTIIYPVSIDGGFDFETKSLIATVDAPYLMKGDMIIENTMAQVSVDGEGSDGKIYLTTQFPTKKGDMVVVAGVDARDDLMKASFDWNIEREKPVGGRIAMDLTLDRDEDSQELEAKLTFQPSVIRFGDDEWIFSPSVITYKPQELKIDNFKLAAGEQIIQIDGESTRENPEKEIIVSLNKIHLLSIFETLDINKALIGGTATGVFHAKGIFGPEISLECPALHVDSIGYNRCTLGNADVTASWNNELKSFHLDADILSEDNRHSHIYGDIIPASEGLDMYFEADRTKVGFMKPFIDAFASDIKGYASGKAHLFGTFKYIDLEGDILAEDLGVKIDFTNTWYFANDSIKLRPGSIDISDVVVKDIYGHTAMLNGVVKHTFFKDPVFDFKVTEAKNFLSYDVTEKLNPDWYGRIFGNGSAFINGKPGVVNIDVEMSTAPDSKFTFVLSDNLEAEEYTFITFRDKNRGVINDSIIEVDDLPAAVREYRDRKLAEASAMNPPSAYNMNIQVDITPEAKIVLVMDPVGGDEINCTGHGNLRMTYASEGNDLRMFGTYTIEQGSYNFTLQDVIVKDFSIKEGSSITFSGDPYNARLDIKAVYAVNANLSDLDESFLQDKELNRTNVPVHALLVVTEDMRQPDISFDLEFPTLTSDIYRKVKSIISTDEMMDRQIIYLLALNRFYTPEYMSSTKGNELFSIASSTISSRLSSMLGKLSDHWTIAPNLRSDRGDFSDVEFDLALSSSLLNNRLRLNGNFGYRDKSLNTNQFIGDFDLEYLLNRAGSWRLKAYNRYNDQNYYLRTAQTTQGVGLVFKKDFDNVFGFLRRKKKTDEETKEDDDQSEKKKTETVADGTN